MPRDRKLRHFLRNVEENEEGEDELPHERKHIPDTRPLHKNGWDWRSAKECSSGRYRQELSVQYLVRLQEPSG